MSARNKDRDPNTFLTEPSKFAFNPIYLLFIVFAVIGNLFSLQIFFGVEFLFGSIATLLAFSLFGIWPGALCGLAAGLATLIVFHYPIAAVAVWGETLFITLLWSRWRTNLILAVSIYWLVIGLPGAAIAYSAVIHLEPATAFLLAIKQASNGILNAIVASLIIGYSPLTSLMRLKGSPKRPAFQTIFTLFVAVSIIPAFFIMTIDARHVLNQVESRTQSHLETISTGIALSTERWREGHINSVALIAKTSANIGLHSHSQLRELTKNVRELSDDFRYVLMTDHSGKVIGAYPEENPQGKALIGKDLSERPYFLALKEKPTEAQLSPIFLSNGIVREPIMTVGRALVTAGKFNGVVVGTLNLVRLQRLLSSIQNNGSYRTTIIDGDGHVVATTAPDIEPLSEWALQASKLEPYGAPNFYRRWPTEPTRTKIDRWKKSYMGLKTKLPGAGNWTLYTELPLAPQQAVLYHQYLRDFLLLLCLFTVILLATLWIAKRIAQPLVQLANETTNLPDKLDETRVINWPEAPFSEFNLLIINFRAMKRALRQRFQELDASKAQMRELAREQAFLAEISKSLAATMQSHSVLTTLAQAVVPEFCDYSFTYILNTDGSVKPVRAAHAEPVESAQLQAEFATVAIDLNKTTGASNIIRTGRSELTPRVEQSEILGRVLGAGPVSKLSTKPPYSFIGVPLKIREQVVACMVWVRFEPGAPYDEHDLEFAQEIAGRAAIALDNAILFNEAESINRVKDEFLATLSHELRTPLNVILGHADILRSELEHIEKDLHPSIDAIFRNAQAQKQIIADLLDISAIITGKISFAPVQLHLADIMNQAVESVRLAASAKEIRLNLSLEARGCQIYGDPVRVQQILWNLLSNAVKFTPAKGTISISSHAEQSHCVVEVADSGQGIDTAFLPHVFDRFRQEDNSLTRVKGGLGLGLSIVLQLVEMHGGTIRAESECRGQGSRFIVTFPLSGAQDHATPIVAQNPPLNRSADVLAADADTEAPDQKNLTPLLGLKVLLIDDEKDAREMVSHFLKKAGATVTSCDSAAAGLQAYQAYKPDLIISDIGMPDVDGFRFLRELRAKESKLQRFTPAIALTAYAREDDRKQALSAGYQRHLAKPVSWPQLLSAVKEVGQGL